jgi:hypothetical protein
MVRWQEDWWQVGKVRMKRGMSENLELTGGLVGWRESSPAHQFSSPVADRRLTVSSG